MPGGYNCCTVVILVVRVEWCSWDGNEEGGVIDVFEFMVIIIAKVVKPW